MPPKQNGLPHRPSSNLAGPSRTRPTPYPPPIPQMNYAMPSPNLFGGYGGYQAPAPVYNPAYGYPAYSQYPAYPYPAYGAYPAMPNPYQSFGQSLFHQPQQPQAIPHYPQMPATVSVEAPNKRHKSGPGPSPAENPLSWRNCSQDGCKFVGPGDKVEEHEGDRHLIFRNGPKVELSEEEQMYASHKGPAPPVFGTSITLHTEEQIAKWVADRRANWPGAERLAQKKAEREQAIARGENPDSKKRPDRRAMDPAAMAEDWGRLDSAPERGGRGRGRDRGRGAERGRGRGDREGGGAGRGRGRGESEAGGGARGGERGGRGRGRGRGGAESGRTQDSGYPASNHILPNPVGTASPLPPPPPAKASPPKASSAAGLAGVGGYESSSSSSGSSSSDSSSDSSDDSMSSVSGDDEDHAAEKAPEIPVDIEPPVPVEEAPQPMCPHWMKNGRCRQGNRCPLGHPADHVPLKTTPAEPPRKQPRQPPQKKPNPFARPSLLGQLLANPIENTLSQLTQTIRFLVANDMLQGVELAPGQAEEQQRQRQLVHVVNPGVEEEV